MIRRHISYVLCIGVLVGVFVVALPRVSVAATFLRNLTIGDTGEDVALLQKVLNQHEKTVVALSGPGSTGNETTYFGSATKDAVIRFQNMYASQILTPAGLVTGTGFVGPATRAMLDILVQNTTTQPFVAEPTQAPSIPGAAFSPGAPVTSLPYAVEIPGLQNFSNLGQFNIFTEADNAKVQVAFLSSNSGSYGSTLEITGTGFSETNNTLHFGSYTISGVVAQSANKLSFQIPTTIPEGVYDVEVSNSKGTSESNAYFIVTSGVAAAPTITSISPAIASFGDEITIIGTGFTPTGNVVHGTLGTFENLSSSDGTTLTLTLKAPAHLAELELLFELDNEVEFTTYFTVANTHGVSDPQKPGVVIIE